MAEPETESRVVEIDEALLRPGTYFNPQTEIVLVVDDSASIDQEVFNMEAYEGADWVRIADEVPSTRRRATQPSRPSRPTTTPVRRDRCPRLRLSRATTSTTPTRTGRTPAARTEPRGGG